MKICIIALLVIVGIKARGQATTDSLYIVTYTTGGNWDASKAPHEQRYFAEHSANLAALRKTGIIKMGARYGDKGIIVIAAPSRKVAHELVHADQAVANNLFDADIQRFNVFYDGCLARQ
ncbi:MAG TPA: hypothetical protein VD816_14420 [Ohtaekwangia sp.]|nr:hypothetical protein [Ohtaekwangia sp.]